MVVHMTRNICSVEGCSKFVKGHGLCDKHYMRLRRGGTLETRAFPPTWSTAKERLEWYGWNVVQRDTPFADGPCWEWAGTCGAGGYGVLAVDHRTHKAHRLAYETWVGPIPEGMVVRHKCDNPPCINPEHLELGTPKDNARDREERGRRTPARGEKHGCAKLTWDNVNEIRSLWSTGNYTRKQLAEDFGVVWTTIDMVVRNKTWKA